MKIRGASLLLLAMLYLTLASIPAVGGEILYTNGPVSGTINAWTISTLPFDFGPSPLFSPGTIHDPGHFVSDSFTLTAPQSDVESVHFFAWTFVEDGVATVNWSILTPPFGIFYTGSAAVTDTLLFYNGGCCDIHEDSFTFPSIDLPAGTYLLTLSGATAGGPFGPHGVMWDQNSGPSLAYTIVGGVMNPIPSEAFYIDGTVIPEPSSIMLFGSGLLGLAGVLRRKLF
jgi:hypothetical protein